MYKTLLAIASILLSFSAFTSVAQAGGDQEYYDFDWGLITRFSAPKEVKPLENFTISFEMFHALRHYNLNVTATVELLSAGGAYKFENLLSNFILEKGQYDDGPAVVRNITFKVGHAMPESYNLVTCQLQLYYAPVGSSSFKTAFLESTLTWTSHSTYQELNTKIENDQSTIQSFLQNNETLTEALILSTIVLVAALVFVIVKYVKKTES